MVLVLAMALALALAMAMALALALALAMAIKKMLKLSRNRKGVERKINKTGGINMIKEICTICIHEDFGYCGLRNSNKEVKTENNEHCDVIKCSEFAVDKERINMMFKLKEMLK
jgi:MFS superfamily sulfate permease-like transporter